MLSQESRPDAVNQEGCYDFRLSELIRQRAWIEINQAALRHNVQQFKGLLKPGTDLMAVIKADAYGHGAVRMAQIVLDAGATWLAIATLGEGIELREAGITAPILILGAINTAEEIRAITHWQLEPTLCDEEQMILFAQTLKTSGKKLPVHLKLDTGMSRLGTSWQKAIQFVQKVKSLPNLHLASIYSHLATADDPDLSIMNLQQNRFEIAIANIQKQGIKIPKLHLANSAATLNNQRFHYDLVRVGLGLYGLYPAPHLSSQIHLKPVLQVKAKISQIKTIPANTGVSYGHHFVSDREMRLAIIGIGYADGIPRNLSNLLKVLIRGQWVQQIGAITMDQMMLDVSHLPNLKVGEVVTLIGKDGSQEISADDWAKILGTISWEILCGFKHRLPRIIS